MIDLIDFSNEKLSSRDLQYAGRAGEKRGIVFNNEFWFLKFPKNTIGMDNVRALSYATSPLSEYIGSHIYEILGYNVHQTLLGKCFDGKKYKIVCACKDFIKDDKNELLISYTALRNDTNEIVMQHTDSRFVSASNLNEILFQLENNTILKTIKGIKERFWETVIIDLLINNNDRNEDNWGVIKNKISAKYEMAPIFDNGNCFYSKTDDTRISEILLDSNKLISSSTNCITAYEDDEGQRISIKKILDLNIPALKNAIKNVTQNVCSHLTDIENLINNIPETDNDIIVMSSLRKEYYIKTFKIRLNMLLNKQIND